MLWSFLARKPVKIRKLMRRTLRRALVSTFVTLEGGHIRNLYKKSAPAVLLKAAERQSLERQKIRKFMRPSYRTRANIKKATKYMRLSEAIFRIAARREKARLSRMSSHRKQKKN